MTGKISPIQENYLEAIYLLRRQVKWVRVKDLARAVKVKAPSVIEALTGLKRKGLVLHERYGDIELTPKGAQLARNIYERHKTLKKFFYEVLALDERAAEENACRIEHYLSQQTIKRMLAFVKFIEDAHEKKPEWLSRFQHFAEKSTLPDTDSA